MLDWLAVGWNMAMTVSGAFLVSQSARQWPLVFDRANAAIHTCLAVLLGLLLADYPAPLIPAAEQAGTWTGHFGDLRYLPLVSLILAYRPFLAIVAGLVVSIPQLFMAARHAQPAEAFVPLLALAGVLLMAASLKRQLDFMTVSLPKALQLTPLIFLPAGLPYFYTLGWPGGIVPALVLTAFNVAGFFAGMLVLQSRFRLLAISARLSQQAHTDPLTGLWNRRQLEYDLTPLAVGAHVLVIDLDYFKTINDRFGHDVGDEYLIGAAAALNRALKTAGVGQGGRPARRRRWVRNQTSTAAAEQAYRLGGEEFALLLPPSSPEEAGALAESVLAQVREVRHRVNPGGQITCSVGLARRLEDETPQVTLRRADMALMQAKANGRDRSESAGSLLEMLSQSEREQRVRPAQPLMWEAINASLSLAALDRELTTEDWTRLLQAAILSVPGAESGTINVRRGGRFVLCAQLGFDDRLLGLSHSRQAQIDWYGLGEAAWKVGKPRVLSGPQVAVRSRGETGAEPQSEHYIAYGRVDELQASLCIPVTMAGEVVGHLNLDRTSDNRPFDEEDLRVARAFADQVTVLMVSDRRRRLLERQRTEQAWLLEFGLDVLRTKDPHVVGARLLWGLDALSGIQGQVLLGDQAWPAEAQSADAHRVMPLPWPGPAPACLLLWRRGEFTPQDLQLIETATRITEAALSNLGPGIAAPG